MKESAALAWNALMRQRLTIWWFALFTINSLCASIMAALAGTDWMGLSRQAKFLVIVSIIASWTNTIGALFKQGVGQPKDSKAGETAPPFPSVPKA